jgi:hypothetical protein
MTKIAVSIVHVAETHGAAVVRSWAHIHVVPLTMAQDEAVPLGAFLIDMVSAILLALTTVEPPLALTLPAIMRVFIALLLGYASNEGVINKGGTNSMTITPCCGSNVAIVGTGVMTSLITSPNSVINMATIVCSGMCTGGGSRDNAHGG